MKNPTIQQLPIDDLLPYARNAKLHPPEQIAQIAASIKEFGFNAPVLVDGDKGIIAGHGRVLAARKLGLATAPCIVLTHLSEAQKRAYIIADNRLGDTDLAPWDWEMLQAEIDALKEENYDYTLTGFTDESLAAAMESAMASLQPDAAASDAGTDTEPQIDRAEELREQWGVKTGDLWLLGGHRLLCGDSTKAEDVAKLMQGELADAVLTDPPYGQNQTGIPNDEPEKHSQLMADVISRLPITDGVVVAFQSPRTFHAWTDAARQAGFTFERMLWMYKAAQCTFPWRGWILKSESIPVCSTGKANWQEVHPFAHDCYYLSEVSGELNEKCGWHGSVKPMSVVSDLLSRISAPGAILYEPFSGSGTMIIAAHNLGRKCRAIEISPAYVAVALQRFLEHTGIQPIRADA